MPVLISALTFSAAHLVLLASGVDTMFIVRIFVHMAGNLMGLVSLIIGH